MSKHRRRRALRYATEPRFEALYQRATDPSTKSFPPQMAEDGFRVHELSHVLTFNERQRHEESHSAAAWDIINVLAEPHRRWRRNVSSNC